MPLSRIAGFSFVEFMSDFFEFDDASMESVGTADAPIVEAAAASGEGVGVDTSQAPAPETPTGDTPPSDQIDPGWTWDEGEDEQSASNDEVTDEDIEKLTQDPALDQEKVPGLVQALRNARTAERERAKELKTYQQQMTQLESFGGVEGAVQTLNLVSSLISDPANGTTQFLQSLYDAAQPAYVQLVTDAIRYNPDYAIEQLRELGKLPADFESQPAVNLDAEALASIPEHLRDIAKALPKAVMDDLMLQTDEVRNYHLEREKQWRALDAQQREAAETQHRQQWEAAQQQGQSLVEQVSTQYEQAHLAQLSKWQPYGPGPENEAKNQMVYGEVLEGAMAQILSDQKFAQMYRDAAQLMANAPLRRLQGERLAGDQDERKARQLAAQFNTRLGQILRERVKERNEVYKGYRAWLESQRGAAPNRREIPGSTMTTQNGVNALGPDGKASPEFLESLASQIRF